MRITVYEIVLEIFFTASDIATRSKDVAMKKPNFAALCCYVVL
jgi:hypothetical protein